MESGYVTQIVPTVAALRSDCLTQDDGRAVIGITGVTKGLTRSRIRNKDYTCGHWRTERRQDELND